MVEDRYWLGPGEDSYASRGRGGAGRIWGGSEEELRSAIERHGCEGAVRVCQQSRPEADCYRLLEEECSRYTSQQGGGRGQLDAPEGSTDWEPGPDV